MLAGRRVSGEPTLPFLFQFFCWGAEAKPGAQAQAERATLDRTRARGAVKVALSPFRDGVSPRRVFSFLFSPPKAASMQKIPLEGLPEKHSLPPVHSSQQATAETRIAVGTHGQKSNLVPIDTKGFLFNYPLYFQQSD